MTDSITCTVCGEIINASLIVGPNMPTRGAIGRGAYDYQNLISTFAQHVGQAHQELAMAFAGLAQTYHVHLIAKMARSTDPEFLKEAEAARALCYWTLLGEVGFSRNPAPADQAEASVQLPSTN